ncbi:MAG: hypothetical protein LUB59_01465 [Candidatus Gastranaerophilales bacterium]|nr:hypothetical protein [Candidatus Gastranaerophilales bacterium]
MTDINNLNSKNLIASKLEAFVHGQKMQEQTESVRQEKTSSDLINRYLENQAQINRPSVSKTGKVSDVGSAPINYKNNLRTMFRNNESVMLAIVPRIFTAEDRTGDELIKAKDGEKPGTFLSAINRLDEVKAQGFNTFHILPIHPPGKLNAMGTAGSLYAPEKYIEDDGQIAIDPTLVDPDDPRTPQEQMKAFINECHKRDIKVMLDLPSCASVDMFNAHPELMAIDKNGNAETPEGWLDIRMFNPWEDKSKRTLNKALLDMHMKYIDSCIDLGIDGIRSDVARAKPTEFWDILIGHARERDPEFAMLGESYTYECASPQKNMPYDRPEDSLRAGFDAIYGQHHIFHELKNAKEATNYINEMLDMSYRLPAGKTLIGSFMTHDDETLMNHGGADFCNLISVVQSTIPMCNPYVLDGFQSGDYYNYKYANKPFEDDSSKTYEVHPYKMDIFNLSRKPGGDDPEIGKVMTSAFNMRKAHQDVLTKGDFIELKKSKDKNDQVWAYARHLNGKTLLVVANMNKNRPSSAVINVPTLKADQKIDNLVDNYGQPSKFQVKPNELRVELGPSRAHVFEIDTPNIEKYCDEKQIHAQNFKYS